MQHFSVHAASAVLERSERCIRKALRHTEPDSHERGQPRYRLTRIIVALQSSGAPLVPQPREQQNGGLSFTDLDSDLEQDRLTIPLFRAFNTAFEEIVAEPSLAKRRKMAISFAPEMINKCVERYRAHCRAEGSYIDADTRAMNCMWWHLLEIFSEPCAWTRDEVLKNFRVYEEVA